MPYNLFVSHESETMSKFSTKTISSSLEDYLEAIYEIIEEKQGVKAVEISRRLGVGRSSVTDALKTLCEKKLVNYGRYDVISLTNEGEQAAKSVITKHKVLFEFFTDILGLTSEDAQKNACRVEHVISETASDKLVAFVQYAKEQNTSSDFIANFKESMK